MHGADFPNLCAASAKSKKGKIPTVKRNLLSVLVLGIILASLSGSAWAQRKGKGKATTTKRTRTVQPPDVRAAKIPDVPPPLPVALTVYETTPAATVALLQALPASDGVLFVDLKRVLHEALPTVLASEPKRLAQINAQLDRFKQQTGLDPRSFERVAVGFRLTPANGGFNADPLVLVNGSFNAGALIAAGKLTQQGKYQEEDYKGRKLYRFPLGEEVSLLGLNLKGKELAVMEKDANTLVFGEAAMLRTAVDEGLDKAAPINAEAIALATRNPNALIGLGGNVPAEGIKSLGLDTENDEIGKTIATIRQAAGAVTLTERGANIALAARAEKDEEAKNLTDTLNALKQFGGLAIGQLKTPAQQKLAANALETLTVTQNGRETALSLDIRRSDFPALLGLIK